MTKKTYKYLFGPVPSRRLGRSLGVDITPMKTCTQNCIYCQLGKDAPQTLERKEYVPIDAVLSEISQKIKEGLEADSITISGSGEPTLNSGLGKLIDGIHRMTDIPVAVITNGTLFFLPEVRQDCAKAEVVLPSLDAGDAGTFEKINRPCPDLDYETYVDGLVQFARMYTGKLWLEVFFCDGVNTDPAAISALKKRIEHVHPAKIQVNTCVRPVANPLARRVEADRLEAIAKQLGPDAEVIADFSRHTKAAAVSTSEVQVLDMLQRRPCSLEDIRNGLGVSRVTAQKILSKLSADHKIITDTINTIVFYKLP